MAAARSEKRVWLYYRISTPDQTHERQRELRGWATERGATVVGETYETASGAGPLDQLAALVRAARERHPRPFDVLAVVHVDRLGRNASAIISTWDRLERAGVEVWVKSPAICSTLPGGDSDELSRAVVVVARSVVAALAEAERKVARERQRAGIAAAKARGVVFGRRRRDRAPIEAAARRYRQRAGELPSCRELMRRARCSKMLAVEVLQSLRGSARS